MIVRPATLADAAEIREVAVEAWRDTYARQMRDETIEGFLDRSYSFERLERRIGADVFLVAVLSGRPEAADSIVAFANARRHPDHLDLLAIYARPAERGHGAGTALLEAIVAEAGALPVAAEVLRGNRKGETFYEARGFVPRETVEIDLLGEPLILRRWWLAVSPS